MLRVGSTLKGYNILATDGGIGSVADLLFDDTTWKLRWLVVDTGGWLSGAKVLIHPSAVSPPDDIAETLSVLLTKKQIENSPGQMQDRPVSQQFETDLYDYYGWDPAWSGSYFGPGAISEIPPYRDGAMVRDLELDRMQVDEGDPHLRSVKVVTGYHVNAVDGGIGHIQDMLIDDESWVIHYLIVDTSNWWMGQHVLLSPFAVREINYVSSTVRLDLTKEKIKGSPPWTPLDLIDEPYSRRLHSYYDWPGYGW